MCLAPYVVPSVGLPIAIPNYRQESVGHPSETATPFGLVESDAQYSHNSRSIPNVCAGFFKFFAKCG